MMVPRRLGKSSPGSALIFVAVAFSIVSAIATAEHAKGSGQATVADFKRLEGKWQRPDGGYIIELKEIGKGGTVKAAYFNPRPINVARAELKRKDGMLTVFIELRDVNYPGSKYNLQYDPRLDRLIGTYFQAVEKRTYDIEFVRSR